MIVLTAVAAGGYAMALLVYVLNRGHCHSLVRHALLTSAVGYTVAIAALGVDVGRPWNSWKVPTFTSAWNVDSVLLEVALCISAYLLVLWLEMSPASMEKWTRVDPGRLGRFARRATPVLDRALVWMTPWLPLVFLLSCWIMGYAAVFLIYILSTRHYRRPTERAMVSSLSRIIACVIVALVALRVFDLLWRGQVAVVLSADQYTWLLALELGGMVLGALVLLRPSMRASVRTVFVSAMAILGVDSMHRLAVV